MYGLIGKIRAATGKRDDVVTLLASGGAMPGCLSYVVAADPTDADVVWVTEVWQTQDAHRASLRLPAVQAAIAKGRQLIARFDMQIETVPIGGIGLPNRAVPTPRSQ